MDDKFEIKMNKNGNHVTVFVVGTINTDTAPQLSETLQKLDYTDLDLTVDMSETEYITSAGLRTLLIARKKLSNDTMRIINVNNAIMDIISMTGFEAFIKVQKAATNGDEYRLSLAALLNKRVTLDPDYTAYIFKDRKYTWMDVEKASHIVAEKLSKIGVKKGTHIGICSVNSINFIFTLFAIQKLGGIAVLINPALRPEEVCKLTDIADVTHLCYAEIEGKTVFDDYSVPYLEKNKDCYTFDISNRIDFTAEYASYDLIKDKFRKMRHADDPASIIFSSGSTGMPKAILASSYSMISGIEPLFNNWPISNNDINLAFLPMFHIFGFAMGISAGLITGYCSVIPENKSPATMINLIEKYGCTLFSTVPTMMLAFFGVPGFSPQKLRTLRITFLGGAVTTEEQFLMLEKALPGIHFCNIYGMSENSIVSITGYGDTVEHITQTVGKPVNNLELIIRDLGGNVLDTSCQGEICIRGDTMVVCYYKLPIEKQPLDDEGWLATGDLGFLDSDGYLHITGRIKDLIICGGENISPGEIADVLAMLPEIADVKVIGIPDEIKGEIVSAAVVLKPGFDWNEEKVRAFAANHLAKYKLPVHYVVMDSFPLLGSGKIDGLAVKKIMMNKLNIR